ncbi:MAG: Transketolase [Watsoniomyces obsoletus]|nr:MAG: Transketolase [Watsoniomyces obsoletus]
MSPPGRLPGVGHARKTKSQDQDQDQEHHRSKGQRENTSVPLSMQQDVLRIFQDALLSKFTPDLSSVVQEIKGHLYARDFDLAFGKPAYREAYAIRWSASRALAYLVIFHDLRDYWLPRREGMSSSAGEASDSSSSSGATTGGDMNEEPTSIARSPDQGARFRVTCLGGGGGAEAVSLATTWSSRWAQPVALDVELAVDIVDRADWSDVIRRLELAMNDRLQGRSGNAESAQQAVDPRRSLKLSFHQGDALDLVTESYRTVLEQSDLVTLMFTLNELYTTSKSRTTAFLLHLGNLLRREALLLVVDSPGSYSTVPLGKEQTAGEKRYPMRWLLDHTLLALSRDDQGKPQWEKIMMDESRWYRLPDELKYPIELENTRYQIHLFRRI